MGIRHMVRRGDSLWSLAGIYLGNGTRYNSIVEYHNKEAARFGRNGGLLPIDDPNLIYVGQTIMVPSRQKNQPAGTGKNHEASTTATGVGLKVEYNFEDGKSPLKYQPIVTPDYTITSQMTGKITIENLTHDGLRSNFELAMAADKGQLTSKLGFGDKAISELTKSLECKFDIATGKVTLEASVAAHANIGPYSFDVEADAPNHLKALYKPEPISAIVEKNKRRYKFIAEIAFRVDITLHPSPRNVNPQTIRQADENPVPVNADESLGKATIIGLVFAYIFFLIYAPKGLILKPAQGSTSPIYHSFDPNAYNQSA